MPVVELGNVGEEQRGRLAVVSGLANEPLTQDVIGEVLEVVGHVEPFHGGA